jgi:hypothetical protein
LVRSAQVHAEQIPDGVELDLMHAHNAGWGVTHDYDGDGVTDLNDKDSDNDGLDDGVEDHNRDATVDTATESDPFNPDTDAYENPAG